MTGEDAMSLSAARSPLNKAEFHADSAWLWMGNVLLPIVFVYLMVRTS